MRVFCNYIHCHLINNNNLDIACITETWLHSLTPDSVVISDSKFLFRKDRPSDGEDGGLVVCVF